MEIKITYNLNSIITIYKLKWRKTFNSLIRISIAFFIFAIIFLLQNKFIIKNDADGFSTGTIIILDILFWISLYMTWRNTILTMEKLRKKYQSENVEIEIILKDNEIIYTSPDLSAVYNWSFFSQYDIYKNHLFLIVNSMNTLVFDVRILTLEQRNELNDFLIKHFNIKGNLSNRRVPKRLYFLGLLCLIPIIGAFAGVILLLIGIFDYKKNKWLITIGCIGILITVTFYVWSAVYLSLKHYKP